MVKRFVVLLIVMAGVVLLNAGMAAPYAAMSDPRDPRIVLFAMFNRAKTYDEAKRLISDGLAQALEKTSSQSPENMGKALSYLQFDSYEPSIVELDSSNSFLILQHAKPKLRPNKEERAVYLVSRTGGQNWTVARRMVPQSVIISLWHREFSPAEFNQPSTCSLAGGNVDPALRGKQWTLKSALAFRRKDVIEVDLYPFTLKEADMNYWKYWSGKLMDVASFQTSSLNTSYPACRIVFGLGQNGQVRSVNIGFNNPKPHFSAEWQGPGWSWAPPQVPKPNTGNGLPPEFRIFEVSKNRLKLETGGKLDAGDQTIRWNAKIDIPLWDQGLQSD